MKSEVLTWHDILSLLEKKEQQRIINDLNITRRTFDRWLSKDTHLPHPPRLKRLFVSLPESVQPTFLEALQHDSIGARYAKTLPDTRHFYGNSYVLEASQILEKRSRSIDGAVKSRLENLPGGCTIASLTSDIEDDDVRISTLQRLRTIKVLSLLALMKDMKIITLDEYDELRVYIEEKSATT